MYIIKSVEVSNFKSLGSVNPVFNDKTNEIVGANGQGKTALLEAIDFVVAGKKQTAHTFLRVGQTEMSVSLTLVNQSNNSEIVATRSFKVCDADGSTMKLVVSKDGSKATGNAGRKLLDEFFHYAYIDYKRLMNSKMARDEILRILNIVHNDASLDSLTDFQSFLDSDSETLERVLAEASQRNSPIDDFESMHRQIYALRKNLNSQRRDLAGTIRTSSEALESLKKTIPEKNLGLNREFLDKNIGKIEAEIEAEEGKKEAYRTLCLEVEASETSLLKLEKDLDIEKSRLKTLKSQLSKSVKPEQKLEELNNKKESLLEQSKDFDRLDEFHAIKKSHEDNVKNYSDVESTWKKADQIVKVSIPNAINSVVGKTGITGLEFCLEDNVFKVNDVHIERLSHSEAVSLVIEIAKKAFDDKSWTVLIDGSEAYVDGKFEELVKNLDSDKKCQVVWTNVGEGFGLAQKKFKATKGSITEV